MAGRRAGSSEPEPAPPVGRVTRSQSAAAALAADANAATVVTAPAPSGGRGGARGAAKKRSALHDLTNGAGRAGKAAAAQPSATAAPAEDSAPTAMLTRRRAASLDKTARRAWPPQIPAASAPRLPPHTPPPSQPHPPPRDPQAKAAAAWPPSAPTAMDGVAPSATAAEAGRADEAAAAADASAHRHPPSSPPCDDVDAAHAGDPMFVGTYVAEIYAHLRASEGKNRPAVDYMATVQSDINATMRGILVDWLVEVAEEYKLVPDTLFLSVAYIDRCLSAVAVPRGQLQLVGVTCMLVAAKYEEIYAPQVDEFCYITDNTYSREEVLSMERRVLAALKFELTTPTAKSFLRRYLRAAGADQKCEFLASFLAELSLLDYGLLGHPPSRVAAACVLVALWALRRPCWGTQLRACAGYCAAELRGCAEALAAAMAAGGGGGAAGARAGGGGGGGGAAAAGAAAAAAPGTALPAVREKYAQHKFKNVACVVPPEGGFHESVWLL